MTPAARTEQILLTLDTRFADAVRQVLRAMRETHQAPMCAYSGRRTAEEQFALWQQGRGGRPGAIVTWADGYERVSEHQKGLAVDCAFVVPLTGGRWTLSWAEAFPWSAYGAEARAAGLVWGGDWPVKKRDRPHVQAA